MTTNKQLRASDKELDMYLSVGIAQVEEERDRYKAECEKLAEMLELFVSNPNGHRYKALGNSMAVPVVQWIGKRIAKQLNDSEHRKGGES